MPWSLFDILLGLPTYALVLFRISGLVLTAPVFGSPMMPIRVRAALVITLAAMIFPLVSSQAPPVVSLGSVVAGAVSEVIIGMAIGLSLTIMITAADVCGRMVAQQAGIALGQSVDPTFNEESTAVEQLYTIVLIFVFLLSGGHRAMMRALLDTFGVIPLLTYHPSETLMLLLVEVLGAAFVVGVRLAAPVLIALMLTELAMGFLTRTMPQLNILSVGFTVRVMVTIGAAALALVAGEDLLVSAVFDAIAMVRAAFGLG
ncbi:MAG: flagellar biosynthetic protein FliR [Phycisphaerae bacterium]|nr:flagellar biosynthetic protein FliR [Phycisphaerae bacterium]